tara:strand:+ start:115 stop:579 length:465 start_codon:yes stop_codon:yes gene_type:complete
MRITESRLRSIIRSIILESTGQVDRLPEKIEDKDVVKLITDVNYIFDGVYWEEEREEFESEFKFEGYLQHLNMSDLDKIIEGIKNFEDESSYKFLCSQGGDGTYKIRPEAFRILGLSDNDITKLREYKSNNVSTLNSPDEHGDKIIFAILNYFI